jgi:hypothetical protein
MSLRAHVTPRLHCIEHPMKRIGQRAMKGRDDATSRTFPTLTNRFVQARASSTQGLPAGGRARG